MRISTFLTVFLAAFVIVLAAFGAKLVVEQSREVVAARQAVPALEIFQSILRVAEKLSVERGPTNSMLGEEPPHSAYRKDHLASFRAATDAAFDGLKIDLKSSSLANSASIAAALDDIQRELATLRQRIDRTTERPLADRSPTEFAGEIAGMFRLANDMMPYLNQVELAVTKAAPWTSDKITVARLAIDLREYAGQLGSVLVPAISAKRPFTVVESLAAERLEGRLAMLDRLLRTAIDKTPGTDRLRAAADTARQRYFILGTSLADRLVAIARAGSGDYGMTVPEFTDRYIAEMQTILGLRDAALADAMTRARQTRTDSYENLLITDLGIAAILTVVVILASLFRSRFVTPLAGLTASILQLAGGGRHFKIPELGRSDDIGRLAAAVKQLHDNALAADAASEELRVQTRLAQEASTSKSMFLANMSHELRTPLNAIIGFTDLMRNKTVGSLPPPYDQYAGYVHDSGTHLLAVINDILDISKIEAGHLELAEDVIDIEELAAAAVLLVKIHAEAKDIDIEMRIPDGLPRATADLMRVKQALVNLLSNSVKFTEPNGSIIVAAQQNLAGDLEIAVTDTGCGMSATAIPHLLEPFAQGDPTIARRHGGTGLGLPLTKSLIELHDGTFEIDSLPGRGTTVTITLPHRRLLSVAGHGVVAAVGD